VVGVAVGVSVGVGVVVAVGVGVRVGLAVGSLVTVMPQACEKRGEQFYPKERSIVLRY